MHGFWAPSLIEKREAGKIVRTKKVITIVFGKENIMFDYDGEVDDLGRAHGYGHAVEFGESIKKALKCSGTFKDDKPHGIVVWESNSWKELHWISREYKDGVPHGKETES